MSVVKRDFMVPKDTLIDPQSHQIFPDARKAKSAWAVPYRAVEAVAMLFDAVTIVMASILSGWFYHRFILETVAEPTQPLIAGAVVASLFVPFCRNSGFYSPPELLNLKAQVSSVAILWFSIIFVLAGGAFALKAGDSLSRGASLSFVSIGFFAIVLQRFGWRLFLAYGLTKGFVSDRSVALIIEPNADDSILPTLTRHGIRVARHLILPSQDAPLSVRKKAMDRVIASIRGSDAQEIIVSADLKNYPFVCEIVGKLKQLPLPVLYVPIGNAADIFTHPQRMIGLNPAFELQHSPQTSSQRTMKRVTDATLALLGLIALSPLMLLIALIIKLDSPGPALFRQRRCGFNGREFVIYKFRTMSVQEDGEHIAQAEPNDPRVTRIGGILRKTSLDELPQLLNVLEGSMSLVGPRPHAVAHDTEYNRLVANYALRHHVKPGLTGWAQVHGFRGRTASPQDMERRVKLDLWYIDNWSFLIDVKILALTPVALIKSDNAY